MIFDLGHLSFSDLKKAAVIRVVDTFQGHAALLLNHLNNEKLK